MTLQNMSYDIWHVVILSYFLNIIIDSLQYLHNILYENQDGTALNYISYSKLSLGKINTYKKRTIKLNNKKIKFLLSIYIYIYIIYINNFKKN